jgi:hypothetical protein
MEGAKETRKEAPSVKMFGAEAPTALAGCQRAAVLLHRQGDVIQDERGLQ